MAYARKEDKAKAELARYHRRRAEAAATLGGECAQCESADALEFDHVDPATKSFSVGRFWSINKVALAAELEKCQLLCRACHREKTRIELTGPREHGTHAMYRNGKCRCRVCRDFFNAYRREWRRKRSA